MQAETELTNALATAMRAADAAAEAVALSEQDMLRARGAAESAMTNLKIVTERATSAVFTETQELTGAVADSRFKLNALRKRMRALAEAAAVIEDAKTKLSVVERVLNHRC